MTKHLLPLTLLSHLYKSVPWRQLSFRRTSPASGHVPDGAALAMQGSTLAHCPHLLAWQGSGPPRARNYRSMVFLNFTWSQSQVSLQEPLHVSEAERVLDPIKSSLKLFPNQELSQD